MNSRIRDIVKHLNEHLSEAEKAFREQEREVELVKLERDIYKEILVKSHNILVSSTGCTNVVYCAIYSKDNGEGIDTDTCIGVFTTKTKALQAILEVCKNNRELNVNGFTIDEFNLEQEVDTGDSVFTIQCDEEAHCETSTTVLDVKCDNHNHGYTDCYTVEYTVDNVYHLE